MLSVAAGGEQKDAQKSRSTLCQNFVAVVELIVRASAKLGGNGNFTE